MKTKKGNFIELDFTASIKEGAVFDTTKREEAVKAGLITEKDKRKFGPLSICIGQEMVVKGLDKGLEDREYKKEYDIKIVPGEAFGMRKPNLVRPAPLSVFKERPVPGMFVDVNGMVAKVVTVTGGRILLDFNPPLAGKIIVYKFKINKIINDTGQKIEILAKPFGLKLREISVDGTKTKAKFEKEKSMPIEIQEKAIEELKKKIKDILGLEFEIFS